METISFRTRRVVALLLSLVLLGTLSQPVLAVAPVPTQAFEAYLKAANGFSGDKLGWSAALDGDTAVVGAPFESSSGAAYVYVRGAGGWTQQQMLKASNPSLLDGFGGSVAISGDTIVIGSGAEDSATTGINGTQADESAENSGAVYVFTRSGGVWTQQAYVKASNTGIYDVFGVSVAIDDDTMVVGASYEDSNATTVGGDQSNNDATDAGAAYVFTRSGTAWTQQAYLKPGNTGVQDFFGYSVSISSNTALIGAYQENGSSAGVNGGDNDNFNNAGAAYVFTRSGTTWSQQAYLKASNPTAFDEFGYSVGVSADTAVIGAHWEDSNDTGVNGSGANDDAPNSGAVYVYTRSGSTWSQQAYVKASNTGINDEFGRPVAVDGDQLVIGAHREAGNTTGLNGNGASDAVFDSGAAYVLERVGSTWTQVAYLKATNSEAEDYFGFAVDVDGDTYVVGSPNDDSNATTVNGDAGDNSAMDAGAAFILGAPCVTAPFSDVPTTHAFCREIEWMKQRSISTGFNDGTYQPAANVTRQSMSAFLARTSGAALTSCSIQPFSDVPVSHPFCKEIQWMKDEGISLGFDDGTYRPSIAVSRQAMAAFMSRYAGATPPACTSQPFTDVPTNHPFCKEIAWVKDVEISTGFNDGTYKPSDNVTRQAMSAFIFRLDSLD